MTYEYQKAILETLVERLEQRNYHYSKFCESRIRERLKITHSCFVFNNRTTRFESYVGERFVIVYDGTVSGSYFPD